MRLAEARVHFIGVGGIGMCGLAELLHNLGATVTGSDVADNANTLRLRSLGVPVAIGHTAENLGACEVAVYSSAIREDNIEYRTARRTKVPLIRRAEALADIMNLKRGIAVAGTHGKTTTTSLTASIFLRAGLDPTIIVGGRLAVIRATAQLGQGEFLIAEADESDGSFTHLSPEIVIITNIDGDHLDYYVTFENLEKAFLDFAGRIPFYGVAIICGDDPKLRRMFERFGKRWISYGENADNDYVLAREGDHWGVSFEGTRLGELRPSMPGKHNASNALAACLAAMQAGVSFVAAAAAVSEFEGVDRRFQHKGVVEGIDFYDDYGHHPTEVRAVLSGFKEKFPDRRLVTVFQPHRYSRTKLCWADFGTSFKDTDALFLLDIYAAGEAPMDGINSGALFNAIGPREGQYVSREELASKLAGFLREGDICLTLGAGDISRLNDTLREAVLGAGRTETGS